MLMTPDGVALRYARWAETANRPRGTVVLAQGRAEFIEKYFDVIDELRSRGFGVLTFDWRGQGGSGRLTGEARKGHVVRFGDYQRDLEQMMTVVGLPDCRPPFYALGHSMGGAILIEAAKDGRTWFERIVLSAPMIGLHHVAPGGAIGLLLNLLVGIGLSRALVPGGVLTPTPKKPFENNPLSSDIDRYRRIAAYVDADSRLGLGDPTIGWVREAHAITTAFAHPSYAATIRQPILIVAAGDERLVSTPASERFARQLRAGACVTIPGARHEILMERNVYRTQFWAAFDAFVPGEQPFL